MKYSSHDLCRCLTGLATLKLYIIMETNSKYAAFVTILRSTSIAPHLSQHLIALALISIWHYLTTIALIMGKTTIA
jgi:hypothetical protein